MIFLGAQRKGGYMGEHEKMARACSDDISMRRINLILKFKRTRPDGKNPELSPSMEEKT